ncbi:MAG: type II toxin-antitoxin system PemK/MazF family toxin [Bacteroidetes bacterium]|nr:type II toxin-antitoxin system PemK/MazF family toxin [Bacteroidota bacterium]
MDMITPEQGDIFLVALDPTIGVEMAKTRPCVVVSNDYANRGSKRASVAPITSANITKVYPFEVFLPVTPETLLNFDSKVACDQVRSIDKQRLLKKLGSVSQDTMEKIKAALRIHFAL